MCICKCIPVRCDYRVVCRVSFLNIQKIQVFHLTPPSLNGGPLGGSILVTAVLPN